MPVQPEFAPASASCDYVAPTEVIAWLEPSLRRRPARQPDACRENRAQPDARPLSSPAKHRTAPPQRGDRIDRPRQDPDAAINRPAETVAAYRVRTAAFDEFLGFGGGTALGDLSRGMILPLPLPVRVRGRSGSAARGRRATSSSTYWQPTL